MKGKKNTWFWLCQPWICELTATFLTVLYRDPSCSVISFYVSYPSNLFTTSGLWVWYCLCLENISHTVLVLLRLSYKSSQESSGFPCSHPMWYSLIDHWSLLSIHVLEYHLFLFLNWKTHNMSSKPWMSVFL